MGWDNHDACAAALPTALAEIEAGRLADRVVVRRAGEVLYANEVTPDGRWLHPVGAREALLAERLRPWDAAETGVFRRQLADVDRRAHDPGLPEDWALAVRRDGERAAALAEPLRRTAQARRQAPGVDYHRLSAEEHRWIWDVLIAPSLLEDITPQERPVAVFVMGQPGSGKTSQAQVLRRALRGRPTRISGDDFKAMHPDYYDLLREEPRAAGDRIRADYRAWQAMAEAAVRERRGDVTIEVAPGSPAAFVESAMAYRRAGYRVELVVLAVRAADSRQGTARRCADVNRLGGHGRFTTAFGHDGHLAVLADAVAAAEQEPVADSVMVWGRDGTVLYRNDRTPQGSWSRPRAAADVLLAEQTRPYTSQEAARFWALQRRLRTELPHYRHDLEQISRLARALMPAHLQPRRLTGPTPVAALPLPGLVNAQPREEEAPAALHLSDTAWVLAAEASRRFRCEDRTSDGGQDLPEGDVGVGAVGVGVGVDVVAGAGEGAGLVCLQEAAEVLVGAPQLDGVVETDEAVLGCGGDVEDLPAAAVAVAVLAPGCGDLVQAAARLLDAGGISVAGVEVAAVAGVEVAQVDDLAAFDRRSDGRAGPGDDLPGAAGRLTVGDHRGGHLVLRPRGAGAAVDVEVPSVARVEVLKLEPVPVVQFVRHR